MLVGLFKLVSLTATLSFQANGVFFFKKIRLCGKEQVEHVASKTGAIS